MARTVRLTLEPNITRDDFGIEAAVRVAGLPRRRKRWALDEWNSPAGRERVRAWRDTTREELDRDRRRSGLRLALEEPEVPTQIIVEPEDARALTPEELRAKLQLTKSTYYHYQAAGRFERFELVPRIGPRRYSRRLVRQYLNREPPRAFQKRES